MGENEDEAEDSSSPVSRGKIDLLWCKLQIKTNDVFVFGHVKFNDAHQLYEQKFALYNHIIEHLTF